MPFEEAHREFPKISSSNLPFEGGIYCTFWKSNFCRKIRGIIDIEHPSQHGNMFKHFSILIEGSSAPYNRILSCTAAQFSYEQASWSAEPSLICSGLKRQLWRKKCVSDTSALLSSNAFTHIKGVFTDSSKMTIVFQKSAPCILS